MNRSAITASRVPHIVMVVIAMVVVEQPNCRAGEGHSFLAAAARGKDAMEKKIQCPAWPTDRTAGEGLGGDGSICFIWPWHSPSRTRSDGGVGAKHGVRNHEACMAKRGSRCILVDASKAWRM